MLVIHPDGGEIRGHLVAQHALHDVQVVIDQRRGLAVFRAALDFTPEVLKEADVGAQFFFGGALRRGAHDETAVTVFALAEHKPFQALALVFGGNLARHTGVIHRRHVNQKTSGQRDVTGNARAFFADRLLGDLHQDFLAFFEQISDQRCRLDLIAAEAASTAAATLATGIECRPLLCPLGVARSTCWRPYLSVSFQTRVAARFGVQQSFGFGLRFFEFQLFGIFVLATCFPGFFVARRYVNWGHLLGLLAGCRNLASYRLVVVFCGAGLLLEFFKSRVFLEILYIGGEVRLLLYDLLFRNRSRSTGIGRGCVFNRAQWRRGLSFAALFFDHLFCFRGIVFYRFRGISAENRSHIHAIEATLLPLPS